MASRLDLAAVSLDDAGDIRVPDSMLNESAEKYAGMRKLPLHIGRKVPE